MDYKKHFPDTTSYLKQVNDDIKNEVKIHTGFIKHIRLAGYLTHYLWTPAFFGMDIIFYWILQIRPKK
jgi:hypothetical protein